MDCFFGGKIQENPIISLEYLWFSVDFLLNQSIDSRYRHLFNERNMEKSFVIDE
jgi:hypothetical protein